MELTEGWRTEKGEDCYLELIESFGPNTCIDETYLTQEFYRPEFRQLYRHPAIQIIILDSVQCHRNDFRRGSAGVSRMAYEKSSVVSTTPQPPRWTIQRRNDRSGCSASPLQLRDPAKHGQIPLTLGERKFSLSGQRLSSACYTGLSLWRNTIWN